MADGQTFSPLAAGNSRIGPNSNTGQKSNLSAPIIDFCTVVLDRNSLPDEVQRKSPTDVLRYLFGTVDSIAVGPIQEKPFNFYPLSACMVDVTGTMCGKIGFSNDDRICISLTGQGCQHARNWSQIADRLESAHAKLTRCDIAVDDLDGTTFNLDHFLHLYNTGAFVMNGRPPTAQHISDLGSGKGCSLYIGQKGHKQLNVYEKGKQLGDPASTHVRCELRLYAKRIDLPIDALRNPGKYYAGAYPMLAAFVVGEAERLNIREQMVNASAVAMVRFMRNQAGTALSLVMDALGDDAVGYLLQHVVRSGRPGRFKNVVGDLHAMVRNQLQHQEEAA